MLTPWLVGLDLGQVSDPSAMAVVRQQRAEWAGMREMHYEVPALERFEIGTSYPDIVRKVESRLARLPKPANWDRIIEQQRGFVSQDVRVPPTPPYTLLIDATGVGRAVGDMFKEVSTWPIYVVVTAGNSVHRPKRDEYHVAKQQLIAPLQVVIQAKEPRRLRVARGIPEAATLVKEANNFQFRRSEKTGDDQYGAWRTGTHDDLLFAVALCIWYGEMMTPPVRRSFGQGQTYARPTGNVLARGRSARARVRS